MKCYSCRLFLLFEGYAHTCLILRRARNRRSSREGETPSQSFAGAGLIVFWPLDGGARCEGTDVALSVEEGGMLLCQSPSTSFASLL